jgi:HEAT repeat protein
VVIAPASRSKVWAARLNGKIAGGLRARRGSNPFPGAILPVFKQYFLNSHIHFTSFSTLCRRGLCVETFKPKCSTLLKGVCFLPLFGLSQSDVERMFSKNDLEGLTKAVSYKKDVFVRIKAAEALGKIADKSAVDTLVGAAKDMDSRVRYSAILALGNIGGTRAVDALIGTFKDSDYSTREIAAETLAKIGKEPLVDQLIVALKDNNQYIREGVTGALIKIGGEKTIGKLVTALKDQTEFERHNAIIELKLALVDRCDANASRWAAEALVKIRGEKAVQELSSAIIFVQPDVCRRIEDVLVQIGAPYAVDALIAILASSSDDKVVTCALNLLGKIGGEYTVDALILASKDKESVFRHRMITALGCIGNKRAVEVLVAALEDENTRLSAINALGKMTDARAVNGLVSAVTDKDPRGRLSVVSALGNIGDARAVDVLIGALKDEEYEIRKEAIIALGKLGDARALDNLIDTLNDRNLERLRLTAAEALERIGDKRAIDGLIVTLDDPDIKVAAAAVQALNKIWGGRRIDPLELLYRPTIENYAKNARQKRAQEKQGF